MVHKRPSSFFSESLSLNPSLPAYAPVQYQGLIWWKRWLRIYIPFITVVCVLSAITFTVVYTGIAPRVTTPGLSRFALEHSQLVTYFFTAISTALAVLISYAFGQSVAFFVTKSVCVSPYSRRSYPMTVDDLHWWITLANRTVRLRANVGWFLVTVFVSAILGLLTSSFATFITRARFLSLSALADGQTELDFTNPSFNQLYSTLRPEIGCDFWPMTRLMSPSCAFANAFNGMLQSGRAAFESRQLGLTSYARMSSLNYNGSTGGILPFTSLEPITDFVNNSGNSINRGQVASRALTQISGGGAGPTPWNLTMTLQGLSAAVLCSWSNSSPIVSTFAGASIAGLTQTTTTSTCNSAFNLTQYTPNLRISAVECASSTPGTTNLYIKHFDYYRHFDPTTGLAATENLTCSVRPFLTNNQALYSSSNATTSIISTVELDGSPTSLQPLLDSHLTDIVHAINNVGQSASNNLVAEAVVQLVTAYFRGDNGKMALVWTEFLRGMIEFDATHTRHVWEAQAVNASNNYPSTAFRTVQAEVRYDAFGWQSSIISLLTLAPIVFISLAALIFLMVGALVVGPLTAFNPIDPASVILATATGNLSLKLNDEATSLREAEAHLERVEVGVERTGTEGRYRLVALERRGSW